MNEHDELPDSEGSGPVGGGADDRVEANLEARFGAAAGSVDLGDPAAMLDTVRTAATKRRRRRQGVGAIAAVGALGLSGVVLANIGQGDDGDLVVSAPVTDPVVEPEPEDDDTSAADGDEEATDDTQDEGDIDDAADAPATTVPGVLRVTPTNSELSSDSALVVEQGFGGGQLYPWKGGFLSIREDSQPQALPLELPDSITEQFPQEVQDLFPDGLPPTIGEATEILQEAGLFDVVSEIVLADPEVSAAIYSQEIEVVRTVRFSEDGIEWRDVDANFPDVEGWAERISTGDRFALVNRSYPDTSAVGNPESLATLEVWSTTDLIEWERQEVPLPESPNGLPDFISYGVEPTRLAVNDAGWVLPFYSFTNVDAAAIVDDEDVSARLDTGELYANGQITDTGVRIEVYDPLASNPEQGGNFPDTTEFTWEQLGVEPLLPNAPGGSFTVTAPWGGDPVRSESERGGQYPVDQVYGTQNGFVGVSSLLELSTDGVQWSPVDLPIEGYVQWLLETESGLLLAISDESGQHQHFVFDAASSQYTPIDLPGLPSRVSPQQTGPGFVMLAQYEDDEFVDPYGPGGSIAVGEVDGYRFEMNVVGGFDEAPELSYTLTNLETGEVVSTEELGIGEFEFEFASEEYDGNIEGYRLFDPETGDELLFMTFEAMTFTPLDADGEALGEVPGSAIVRDYSEPTIFLVASVDGQLIVEQLTDPDAAVPEIGIFSVAVSSGAVLVSNFDGTFERLTPEG